MCTSPAAMGRVVDLVAFTLILLAFTEVRCKEFKVYWNVPTGFCKNFNVSFDFVAQDYGFTQNSGDFFKGDKITIFYNPGLFPAVYNYTHNPALKQQNLKDLYLVNGGIPQDADTAAHLDAFSNVVDKEIPDVSYDGTAIIDMEQWGATWAQNFNNMEVNRILSRLRVQNKFPTYTTAQVEKQARQEYERAAFRLMYTTLVYAQTLRPNAKWGYYQYPQCFNKPGVGSCSKSLEADNNLLLLLWRRSGALYPSLYLDGQGTIQGRALQIRGMVKEVTRVQTYAGVKSLNIPYIWYRYFYKEGNILDEDLHNLMRVPKEEGADGVIVWGSWHDVNTRQKCLDFLKYVMTSLGPIAQQYISKE